MWRQNENNVLFSFVHQTQVAKHFMHAANLKALNNIESSFLALFCVVSSCVCVCVFSFSGAFQRKTYSKIIKCDRLICYADESFRLACVFSLFLSFMTSSSSLFGVFTRYLSTTFNSNVDFVCVAMVWQRKTKFNCKIFGFVWLARMRIAHLGSLCAPRKLCRGNESTRLNLSEEKNPLTNNLTN